MSDSLPVPASDGRKPPRRKRVSPVIPRDLRKGLAAVVDSFPKLRVRDALFLVLRKAGATQAMAYKRSHNSNLDDPSARELGHRREKRLKEVFGLTPQEIPFEMTMAALSDATRLDVMMDTKASNRDRLTAAADHDRASGRNSIEVTVKTLMDEAESLRDIDPVPFSLSLLEDVIDVEGRVVDEEDPDEATEDQVQPDPPLPPRKPDPDDPFDDSE